MAANTAADDYEDLTAYAAARREELGPPPGFRMYGETFVGEPVLRASSLLDLITGLDVDRLTTFLTFLEAQLTPESWTRFEVLFRDRSRPVDDLMLDAACTRMVVGYTGRPTKESSSSPATPSKRGKNSKGGSRPRPATGLRSA